MPLQKINAKGAYTYFPGVTVISNMRKEERSFGESLHQTLSNNPLINSNFSLLPVKSFHITAINLFTKDSFSHKSWSDTLKSMSDIFISINEYLKISPPPPAEFTLNHVVAKGVIQLIMTPSRNYKKYIKKMAEQLQIEAGMPSEYHMTLAYQYQYISDKTLDDLSEMINTQLARLFNCPLLLNPPELHYFHDMTNFIKWDGVDLNILPSHERNLASSNLFLQKKATKEDKNVGQKNKNSPNCTIS